MHQKIKLVFCQTLVEPSIFIDLSEMRIPSDINPPFKVAIITYDWQHLSTALKIASKDKFGKSLAFNVDKHNLDSYSQCCMSCHCGSNQKKKRTMFKPNLMGTCCK